MDQEANPNTEVGRKGASTPPWQNPMAGNVRGSNPVPGSNERACYDPDTTKESRAITFAFRRITFKGKYLNR
jgi:hypothetical protein